MLPIAGGGLALAEKLWIDWRRGLVPCVSWRHEVSAMYTGTVKWFNSTMGYGFIQPDVGGAVAFVHISAVQQAGHAKLSTGQRVRYDLIPGRDGDAAENLKLVA
jgi:cold shock protein